MSGGDPVFITGASGFIGGKLARRLLVEGRRVRVLARRPLPELEKLGAKIITGDLHDLPALRHGCDGTGTVFHVAGRVGVWGPASDFFRVNVGGTQNIIAACRSGSVPRLIYTSSPSVVYNGRDLSGVDETVPLCTAAPSPYPTSKAAAEQAVAQANGSGLVTISLRPHLVWGPGDRNLIPRVLELAKKGRLKIVGAGKNLVDCTHVENVVDAHLLAEMALRRPAPAGTSSPLDDKFAGPRDARGRAYFISNDEPVALWDWINEWLRGVGIPEISNHLSLGSARRAGAMLETLWRILPLKGEPPMTRFIASELATDHWFKIDAARRDLGYNPRVTMAEGTAELIDQLRTETAP